MMTFGVEQYARRVLHVKNLVKVTVYNSNENTRPDT
jgi:hypothetical protein